jgi:hypothetical protein
MLQILLILQDPYKHLSSIVLISRNTRDQSFISISFLGVNKLFHVKWKFIPNNIIPIKNNFITSTWFNLKDWPKIQGRINEYNQFYSLAFPRSQNLWSSHNAVGILLRTKHILHSIQNSQKHQTWSPTQPI